MGRPTTPTKTSMQIRVFNSQAGFPQQETRELQKSKILTELSKSPLMLKAYLAWLKKNEDTPDKRNKWAYGRMNGQW